MKIKKKIKKAATLPRAFGHSRISMIALYDFTKIDRNRIPQLLWQNKMLTIGDRNQTKGTELKPNLGWSFMIHKVSLIGN